MRLNTESTDAGPLIRLLVILFVKLRSQRHIRRLWKPSPGIMSAFNVCIKVNAFANLAEADAMRYVARHTSVPVPKVYYAFVYKDNTYIVMSRIKGKMAWNGWLSRTEQSKARILGQLRRMVAELRSIPPPEGAVIGGVDGGPFYDCRLPSKLFWGPYKTTRDFHAALVDGADLDMDCTNLPEDMSELFGFYREGGDRLVLTHGDLSSLNIMVKEDEDEVAGIVDWETTGWFPPYWEYTSAKNVNPHNVFWADEVDAFVEPMPYELRMENIRRKYFGNF